MGRPRKPLAVLEASGSTKKDPQRFRNRSEARIDAAIGDPPADFLRAESTMAQRCLRIWYELIAQAPAGVLTAGDRIILANACRVQCEIESGKRDSALFAQMRAYLSELGMTPAARSKVTGADHKRPDSENPWQQIAGEVRARAN